MGLKNNTENNSLENRRSFLSRAMSATVCAAAIATTGIEPVFAKSYPADKSEATTQSQSARQSTRQATHKSTPDARRLRLVNVHTHEKISVVYRKGNVYLPSALKQIDFLLRDYRVNEIKQIDTKTIDYLYELYAAMDTKQHIQIMSGYRSLATNEMLRKRSKKVAKNSLHIVGKAIDFRIPGRKTKHLQLAALDLKLGGIGYYQKSDFVHIDSGSFRHW